MTVTIIQCHVLEVLASMAAESVLAYCAGVSDSDGTIGVKHSTYQMRRFGYGNGTYSARITVRQVEPQAVDLLHSVFGGARSIAKPSVPK